LSDAIKVSDDIKVSDAIKVSDVIEVHEMGMLATEREWQPPAPYG
jgi:hypothetical protein